MPVLRNTLRRVVEPVGSPATFFLVLLLFLSAVVPAGAVPSEPAGSAESVETTPTQRADELLEILRERDQALERWARQLAHPEGVAVDEDEARRFTKSLARMELWIQPLADDHPELASKHSALKLRARELLAATSRSRAENSDLVTDDESLLRLQVAEDAFVATGSGPSELSDLACGAAAAMNVGARSVPDLDGSREALIRFVAPEDGRYSVDTAGSRTDTRLLVTDGCRGAELARGGDESSLRARTQFSVQEGQAVWIRVGSDRKGFVRLAVEHLGTEGGGTASISGTVTARVGGQPIEDLHITAENNFGSFFFAQTDASGNYQFTSLPAGTYEVYTRDFDGDWVNQIWQDIECGVGNGACLSVMGDPIAVADAQDVTGIDFSLGRSAAVSGRVTDSGTGEPLAGVEVEMIAPNEFSRSTYTDENGRFRFLEVGPAAVYFLASSPFYGNELYDDVPCNTGCEPEDTTPVIVNSDEVVSGIDFALDRIAGVSGVVTRDSDGTPVSSGSIDIYDDEGMLVTFGYTNFDGSFFVPVPDPGVYFALVGYSPYDIWVSQMWQGVDCEESCDLGLATPIILGANEVAEISFEVLQKGRFGGTVSAADAGSMGGSFDTRVRVYDDTGAFVDSEYADSNGDYASPYLVAGDYYATASNSEFRSEIYDDVPCAAGNNCDPLLGDLVAVQNETTTSGIDFDLDRLGIIEGRVTRVGSLAGIPNVSVLAATLTEGQNGGQAAVEGIASVQTDGSGEYRLVGLEADTYYLRTISSGYLDEAYDDVPCEGGCDLGTADPVVVPAISTVVDGIDFDLPRRAWIEGTVTDSETGGPLNADITVLRADGSYATDGTAIDGTFLLSGLDDGSYYLITDAWPDAYVNELHEDVYCEYDGTPSCDLMSGTLVTVSLDNGAEVDFELDRGGAIQGYVDDVQGNWVSGAVYALDALGNVVQSIYLSGFYEIVGLPAGDYYVVTSNTGHRDELWPNTPCFGDPFPNCTLTDGVPVSVSLGVSTAGIDFVLSELGTISGRVVDSVSGLEVDYTSVWLYDSTGDYIAGLGSEVFSFTEIPPGTYYLRTINAVDHIDRVYGGELCDPGCDPTTGAPIVVGLGEVISGIEIPLPMGPGIKGRVFDGPTGDPLQGVSIDLWDVEGDHRATAITDSEGWFRLPYQPGTYFISTYNDDGLEDFLFDGIPCPDGSAWEGLCDPTAGTPFVIEQDTPLQHLDLPFGDPTIFGDGFESGDTSAWSVVVGGS